MAESRILYDGWSLVYFPNSPAALHLLTILALHPSGFMPMVALPGNPAYPLPEGIEVMLGHTTDTGWGWLDWEQRVLPALARRCGARLIHLTGGAPALFSDCRTVLSPTGYGVDGRSSPFIFDPDDQKFPMGLGTRLRLATGQGGMTRLSALLWPEILPINLAPHMLVNLPPVVHPIFQGPYRIVGSKPSFEETELPEAYIIYHGPDDLSSLRRVLESWSWAAGSLGQEIPLLLVGLRQSVRGMLTGLLTEYGVGNSVRALPILSIQHLAELYRASSAVFYPADTPPWSGTLHLALAIGRPLVAIETRASDALVGPAGYLVPYKDGRLDHRGLAAALITLILEETLAERIAEAAWGRAQNWAAVAYRTRLTEVYASRVD